MRRAAFFLVGAAFLLAGEGRGRQGRDTEAPKELTAEELKAAAKPVLVLDPGGHTGPVTRVLFAPDGKQVITVAHDKTVRLWDVESGQTVRVLRPPVGPGAIGDLFAGALSPDGKTLAVAGWGLLEKKERVVGVHLVSLPEGPTRTLKGHTDAVTCLAFSPDGKRLASGSEDRTVRIWDTASGECVQTLTGHNGSVTDVAFAPSGRRLLTGSADRTARLWSVASGKEEAVLEGKGLMLAVGWTADGKTIVTAGHDNEGLRVWNADGTPRKTVALENPGAWVHDLAFKRKGGREVLCTWRVSRGEGEGHDFGASFVDLATGTWRPALPPQVSSSASMTVCALSADGRLGAVSGGDNHQTLVWSVADGKVVQRLAGRGRPRLNAAWGKGKDGTAIAWGSPRKPGEAHPPLTGSFRLGDLTLSTRKPAEAKFRGAWTEWEGLTVTQTAARVLVVKEGDKVLATVKMTDHIECFTLLPGGKLALGTKYVIHLFDARTGEAAGLRRFLSHRGRVMALAPSPDGKYLLSASADQTVRVYGVDHPWPLVTLFIVGNEWVAWTPEGYYAASAGGERLMGWLVKHGPTALAGYYEAAQFRKTLYRPDVIQRLLSAGSVARALEEADRARGAKQSAVVEVEEVLPPTVTLSAPGNKDLKLAAPELEVEVEAKGGKQSVASMQILLDGRPYQGSVKTFRGTKPGAAVREKWKIQVPEGEHTLRAVARTEDGMGLSNDLEVAFEKPAPKPKLYLLAVGIDVYKDRNLKLNCAVNDAVELEKTFRTRSQPLFDVQSPTLLTDKKATREGILQALAGLKEVMKQRDVAVVFYAGHGEQDGKSFYLLPHDADVTDLKKTGISGEELKQHLAVLPGKVLLLLDACHSGAVGKAIQEITRDLADEDCGVIVVCAALGSEKAGEADGHGFFCRSMLEALRGDNQAPRNVRDGLVYLHHLVQYVIDRVGELSKDEQHPTTVQPAIRPLPVAKP